MIVVDKVNTFYGLSHILFDLSLEVCPNEIVCVLGRNGVGKTTLLRTVMGLTPPKSGSIKLNGTEVTGKRPYQLARLGMGYVPAERRIFPDLTAKQNLEIARKAGPSGTTAQQWTIPEIIEFFPILANFMDRLGNQLSGGEQQVLAVARALMGNADFLLLDEPSEGLSPLIVGELGDRLATLKDRGVAVLICEQNSRFAFRLSSRGYVIDKGRVLHEGPVELLCSSKDVKDTLAI